MEYGIDGIGDRLLEIILRDRTTGRGILWATGTYGGFSEADEMDVKSVKAAGIVPRVMRDRGENLKRTRGKAEVFTPSWVCNEQNNLVDEEWFGTKDAFNSPLPGHGWKSSDGPVRFSGGRDWRDYVLSNRMEITCGEAPYLTSRYDSVSGEPIPVSERIGLLDRKMRVVSENAAGIDEWLEWSLAAYRSSYGFEYQGDSLLMARANMLHSFMECFEHSFGGKPPADAVEAVADTLSWNLWQMDGLTLDVPFARRPRSSGQMSLIPSDGETEPIPCVIMDWKEGRALKFASLMERDGEGK